MQCSPHPKLEGMHRHGLMHQEAVRELLPGAQSLKGTEAVTVSRSRKHSLVRTPQRLAHDATSPAWAKTSSLQRVRHRGAGRQQPAGVHFLPLQELTAVRTERAAHGIRRVLRDVRRFPEIDKLARPEVARKTSDRYVTTSDCWQTRVHGEFADLHD